MHSSSHSVCFRTDPQRFSDPPIFARFQNEHAWSLLKDGYFFADLETLLDAEELAQLKPLLQWVSDTETGKENALAIDITDSDFAKTYLRSQGKLYLAFPGNTDNLSYTRPFLQYLGLCEK